MDVQVREGKKKRGVYEIKTKQEMSIPKTPLRTKVNIEQGVKRVPISHIHILVKQS